MEIRNEKQLTDITRKIVAEAVDAVAGAILAEVQYYVLHNVYGNGNVPTVYTRTNEFLNSWTKDISSKKSSKTIEARIFSDASKMSYVPSEGIHGSYEYGDLRGEMAEVIEEGIKYAYPKIRKDKTWNPAAKKRRFFYDVIVELNKNRTLFSWLEAEMQARGMPIKRK